MIIEDEDDHQQQDSDELRARLEQFIHNSDDESESGSSPDEESESKEDGAAVTEEDEDDHQPQDSDELRARLEQFIHNSDDESESCSSSSDESELVSDDEDDVETLKSDDTSEHGEVDNSLLLPTTTSPPICTEEYTFLPGCTKQSQSCGNCPLTHKSNRDLAARNMRFDMSVVSF
jgi:hypothetical protein